MFEKLYPIEIRHPRNEKKFLEKMAYLNELHGDLEKYNKMFPNIPERLLRAYYLEYLDRWDYLENLRSLGDPVTKNISIELIFAIFKYTDFPQLVKLALCNSVIYRTVVENEFIGIRLKWEVDHYEYLSSCIIYNRYDKMVYDCEDPMERAYKNQVILKRNLYRINPPGKHELCDATEYSVFEYYFKKNYFDDFDQINKMRSITTVCHAAFDRLTKKELYKYKHAVAVARRYGFVFCFRNMHWTCKEPVPYIDFCHEKVVNETFERMVKTANTKRLARKGTQKIKKYLPRAAKPDIKKKVSIVKKTPKN